MPAHRRSQRASDRKREPGSAESLPSSVPPLLPPLVGRVTFLALAGFLVLSALVYRGLWHNGFYQDDYHWLLVARTIAASPAALFGADAINPEVALRLTQRLVMGLTWSWFGMSTVAHHLASIVLHAIASTLVFRMLLVLHVRAEVGASRFVFLVAALGAVLYATTSNHSMAVLWLAAQSTILEAAAIAGLTLVLVQREGVLRERRTLALAAGLFLLALVSKNTVVGFPLVVAAMAFIAPLGARERVQQRAWVLIAALLAAMSLLHLVFTKLILFGGSWSGVRQKTALSLNVVDNLSGALLAPFVSATDYESLARGEFPYQAAAIVFTLCLLVLARWLGVFRPVLWGLSWVIALALPVTFMNYEQYDSVHLTVTRYYYSAMIGAAIVFSFLLRGALEKAPRARWIAGVSIALTLGHVVFHDARIERDRVILREWGTSIETLISKTRERGGADMRPGTVICAVGWPMEDAFVWCLGQLRFEPAGYELRSPDQLERSIEEFQRGELVQPWVSIYDAERTRFGMMPMRVYLEWRRGRNR